MKLLITLIVFIASVAANCDNDLPNLSPINLQKGYLEVDELAGNIMFELLDYQEIRNGTINVSTDRKRIMIVDPNEMQSNLNFTNVTREWQIYHLRGMEWKIPSEHTYDGE